MNAIEISGITKTFDNKTAVKNLSMNVPQGSIYGFIGQNGAGKSTTQKVICGLIRQNKGTVKLLGKSNKDATSRRGVGILIETPALFPYSSAYENMMLQALNLGLKNPHALIISCLDKVGLRDVGKKKVKNFSLGMKQRLAIAVALLGEPSILILDEPINGLDPNGIIEIRNTLIKLNKEQNITILISSHMLGELSRIATHYGIIKNGTMVQEISADELSKQCENFLTVKADSINIVASVLADALPDCNIIKSDFNECKVYGTMDGKKINEILFQNGVIAEELSYHRMDLEEYFLKLMGEM